RPREIALSKVLHDRERLNAAIFVPTSDYLGRVRLEELKPQDRLIEESMKPQEFFLPQLSKDYKFRLKDRGDSFERQRVTRVIGYPIQFVYAQLMHILPVHLRRNDGLAQLGIELNFTVGTNGRISDIKINSENSPRNLVRLMKKVLRQVTYRPRMINGKPVETSNVKIYQTFEP
ncbi:MAG TPA: hypothetical protein EYQ00_03305, partial [Dehalococcoidia bacterium]|nr:hypothetical protein [Dehalococcoidia bacterium]